MTNLQAQNCLAICVGYICILFNIISANRCAYLHFFDMLRHRNATCHLSPLVFDGKGDNYQPAGTKLQRKKNKRTEPDFLCHL